MRADQLQSVHHRLIQTSQRADEDVTMMTDQQRQIYCTVHITSHHMTRRSSVSSHRLSRQGLCVLRVHTSPTRTLCTQSTHVADKDSMYSEFTRRRQGLCVLRVHTSPTRTPCTQSTQWPTRTPCTQSTHVADKDSVYSEYTRRRQGLCNM